MKEVKVTKRYIYLTHSPFFLRFTVYTKRLTRLKSTPETKDT